MQAIPSLELVEHVSFVAFLPRRIERYPRAGFLGAGCIRRASKSCGRALRDFKGLAEAPDAFVFAGRDFVDAVRRVKAILSRLESSDTRRIKLEMAVIPHRIISSRRNAPKRISNSRHRLKVLEKQPKLNSQLATVSELCRLVVAQITTMASRTLLRHQDRLAEILEISSFDFSAYWWKKKTRQK